MKDLCKFQVDTPKSAKVMDDKKISIHLYCGSHVGGEENSVFVGLNDFKFGTETRFVVL